MALAMKASMLKTASVKKTKGPPKTKKPTIAAAPGEKTKKIKGRVSEEDKATGGRGSAGEE